MDIKELQEKIIKFRDARDWKQFHNPKDLAISMLLESAEVLEHFQWKNAEEMAEHLAKNRNDVADELADVFYWILLMSHDLNIDLVKAVNRKMKENEKKYPVRKSKGSHKKYNQL